MRYYLKNAKITDNDIREKISSVINIDELDLKNQYDISINFYNNDIDNNMLDADISFEIKKHHYVFIRQIRDYFKENGININEFNLIGTITNLKSGQINVEVSKSKYKNYRKNDIIPSKEMYLYADGKNTLNFMLNTKQISIEEYEDNIEILQEQLNVFELEEESRYIN
jgi:hypothetical protein